MIKLNGVNLPITTFPNNEIMIVAKESNGKDRLIIEDTNVINFKFQTNEDLINLMFLKKHIDNVNPFCKNILDVGYMPYSRMDRTQGTTVFTLKYVCELINDLMFDKVLVNEPHSHVCVALLDRVQEITHIGSLVDLAKKDNGFNEREDFIYFPDVTAEKRQSEVLAPSNSLTGLKHRDFSTGEIVNLEVVGDLDKPMDGKIAIMVDDLCSYGGTFIKGAEKLRKLGFSEIYLVVEHCETSILNGKIFKTDLIDKVYTTNSIIFDTTITRELEEDNRLFLKRIK